MYSKLIIINLFYHCKFFLFWKIVNTEFIQHDCIIMNGNLEKWKKYNALKTGSTKKCRSQKLFKFTEIGNHSTHVHTHTHIQTDRQTHLGQGSATDSIGSSADPRLIIDMRRRASIRASPSWTNCSSRSCSVTSMLTSYRGVRRHSSSPNRPASVFSEYSISSMWRDLRCCRTSSLERSPFDSA